MAPPLRFALRSALWLFLGGWVGAWLLFGLVVAPVSFRTLPSTELAGMVVSPVLMVLHLYGAVAGLALGLIAAALGRGSLMLALPLVMAALCLYSHFGLTAQISELRELAFGPTGNTEAAVHWGQLHRNSMTLFIAIGIGALVLLGLHVHAEGDPVRS